MNETLRVGRPEPAPIEGEQDGGGQVRAGRRRCWGDGDGEHHTLDVCLAVDAQGADFPVLVEHVPAKVVTQLLCSSVSGTASPRAAENRENASSGYTPGEPASPHNARNRRSRKTDVHLEGWRLAHRLDAEWMADGLRSVSW